MTNKLTTLETIMNLSQTDISNASSYYDRQLTRGIQLYNLISGAEATEETRADKVKNEAQANLNTLTNLFKGLQVSWDDLSATNQQAIEKLELSAGLPVGITEAFMNAKPEAEVLATTTSYDAVGNQIITFIYKGADGKAGAVEVVRTGGMKTPEEPTIQEKETAEIKGIESRLKASAGKDGYVDPGVFQSERIKSTIGPDEFNKRFGHLLSPQERVNLGLEKSTILTVEQTLSESKSRLIQFKNAGYSRKETENQWKADNNVDSIPDSVKKIFDEVWGEEKKWWEIWK
jgi:hypothetical protein